MKITESERTKIIEMLPGKRMPKNWYKHVAKKCACSQPYVFKVWAGEIENNNVLHTILSHIEKVKKESESKEEQIKQTIDQL